MRMFTMLASVLVIMNSTVTAMLVNMGMLVFVLMCMALSGSSPMFMAMDVLMGMGTFHRGLP